MILPPTLLRNHSTLASICLRLSSLFTPVSEKVSFLSFLIFNVSSIQKCSLSLAKTSNSSFLLLWDVELLKRISYVSCLLFLYNHSPPLPLWSSIWLPPTFTDTPLWAAPLSPNPKFLWLITYDFSAASNAADHLFSETLFSFGSHYPKHSWFSYLTNCSFFIVITCLPTFQP